MGKRRRHEDAEEAQTPPSKKSKKVNARSERRRERQKEAASRPSTEIKVESSVPQDYILKKKHKKKEKLNERKQQKREEVTRTLVTHEDEGLPDETVVPEDAIDYNSEDAERERERQKKKALKKIRKAKSLATTEQSPEAERTREVKKVKKPQQSRKAKQSKPQPTAKWTLSGSSAGRFIDHDPIFVKEPNGKEYLIAAVARELQVLSIETSLLVRSFSAPEGAAIVDFAVESPLSNLIYIADSNGRISLWDWTTDLPAPRGMSVEGIIAMAAVRSEDDDEDINVPYIRYTNGAYGICTSSDTYVSESPLTEIQVLGQAEYIVARGPHVVVIGMQKEGKGITWVELPLTKPSTCIDARMVALPATSKKASKARAQQLQLAIGNVDGQIHLYDDVSLLFAQDSQQRLPSPRILHWHRTAVSSVKFSPDGNYLISGGKETVLVLWQLETGKQQFLPHLTSEIERVVVNQTGDRYALQMGDNSIMVLSTAELKPVANFAGLQMQVGDPGSVLAATLHPKHPKQLLVTVPATQPKSVKDAAPRPFLQTFDLRTAHHVTRQALTRNNATDLNVGPEDNPILPPDVAHLALSRDGEWLATIDEWMPPASDVAHLAPLKSGIAEERYARREVYLKFWHWDESQELWTLSTRADAPHSRAGGQSLGVGRVLALTSGPASNSFATVGEDSCVKMWKPKTRMRSGVAVKDAKNMELVEWTCRRSVQLSSNKERADSPMNNSPTAAMNQAALAYSNDGSLLAVAHTMPTTTDDSTPAITFIDTATGAIKSTNTSLSDGNAITAIAFLERHFITVSSKAAFVWDLVNDSMMQKIRLTQELDIDPLLAVNENDQTFALVTPAGKEGVESKLEVYTTRHPGKLYRESFETRVVKVLSAKGGRGFVLLFADATVRTILPTGSVNASALSALVEGSDVATPVEAGAEMEVDDVEPAGLLLAPAVKTEVEGVPAFEADEDDRPVVRPEQFADIFDIGQSFAMPPVKDMFRAVVGLFSRRPAQQQKAQEVL